MASAPLSLLGASSFVYQTASNRPLRIHIFNPNSAGEHPAILFFFGGGWRVGSVASFQQQARAFAKLGYVAAIADYRVKCRDGTTPVAATKDAEAAYAWFQAHSRALHIDPRRIVVSGGSAGGQLAAVTTMKASPDSRPAALVLFNPAVDLVSPAPWYEKPIARFISPSSLSFADLPPTIIFHGQSDHRVPIASVRRFCRLASAAARTCQIVEYRDGDHGFYHSQAIDPLLGRSDFADTLDRAERFLGTVLPNSEKPRQPLKGFN